MVVSLNDHKYEVDFGDLEVCASYDAGMKFFTSMPEMISGGSATKESVCEVLHTVMDHIDAVVGAGVSAESFGTAMNTIKIIDAWANITDAYAQHLEKQPARIAAANERSANAFARLRAAQEAIFKCEETAQEDTQVPVRKPVRVE